MRYHFREGAEKKKKHGKKFWLTVPAIGLLVGGYALLTALSPMLTAFPGASADKIEERLKEKPGTHGDRLFIPQINVDVAIIRSENASALERGAWHRNPEAGDPVSGGNFILTAPRFVMGATPGETRMNSPFYNLGKLQAGHQLFIDYGGERYGYEIVEKQNASSIDPSGESAASEARLTLYASTPEGEFEGPAIIVAKPLGKVEELQAAN